MAEAATASAKSAAIRTLAIDIGGTGIKAIVLDQKGAPLTERARVETPQPATPDAVIKTIVEIVAKLGDYDRVSVGYPGLLQN
jgi:polyphosphate glucokinase